MNASSAPDQATPRLAPEAFAERAQAIEREVGRVIVGQAALVRQTLTGLLANSHVLLEGVPGLGKTMLVRTIADVIDCNFNRIQFTPDLMPADITGTNILIEEGGQRVFRFQPGPIFANLVLADEINRATPKTQSSLLEAMQEHQVTVARQRYPARCTVLRAGDPEPARDGGDLSPPRGAARSVPVQGHGPLPVRGGPHHDHGPHDGIRGSDSREGLHRRRDRRDAAPRSRRPDRAARDGLRGQRAGRDPSRPATRARARPRLRPLRRLAARRPGAGDRRARSTRSSTAGSTSRSTTSAPSPCRRCATGSS